LRQAIRALARRILSSGQLQIQASESKHPLATEPRPAWVELKGEPIEVQEFLQSVVREFQRRVGENHASEDTWPFVRYLNDCEGYVRVQRLRETDRRVSRPGGNQVAAQFKRHRGAGTDWCAANSL